MQYRILGSRISFGKGVKSEGDQKYDPAEIVRAISETDGGGFGQIKAAEVISPQPEWNHRPGSYPENPEAILLRVSESPQARFNPASNKVLHMWAQQDLQSPGEIPGESLYL